MCPCDVGDGARRAQQPKVTNFKDTLHRWPPCHFLVYLEKTLCIDFLKNDPQLFNETLQDESWGHATLSPLDLIVKHPFVVEIIAVKVYIQVPLIRLLPFTLENCMEWVFSWAVIKWLSMHHPQLFPATAPEGRCLQ